MPKTTVQRKSINGSLHVMTTTTVIYSKYSDRKKNVPIGHYYYFSTFRGFSLHNLKHSLAKTRQELEWRVGNMGELTSPSIEVYSSNLPVLNDV